MAEVFHNVLFIPVNDFFFRKSFHLNLHVVFILRSFSIVGLSSEISNWTKLVPPHIIPSSLTEYFFRCGVWWTSTEGPRVRRGLGPGWQHNQATSRSHNSSGPSVVNYNHSNGGSSRVASAAAAAAAAAADPSGLIRVCVCVCVCQEAARRK